MHSSTIASYLVTEVGNKILGETYITMTCRHKCVSDICVRGNTHPYRDMCAGNMIAEETRIPMTPESLWSKEETSTTNPKYQPLRV